MAVVSHQIRRALRERKEDIDRRLADERANTWTSGASLFFALVGFVALLFRVLPDGSAIELISVFVYSLSMVMLQTASTLYHHSSDARRKWKLRQLDHSSIYVFIAGSYTPFLLVGLKGWFGWALLVLIWVIAVVGVALKVFVSGRSSLLSTGIYLSMGWISLVAIKPLYVALGIPGFALLVGGGVAYSFGTIFFSLDHKKYFHAIWHGFVFLGCVLHYVAIYFFVFSR